MKKLICILVLTLSVTGYSEAPIKFGFSGNVDYTQSQTKSLVNHFDTEYRVQLWEPSNKKCMVFFGGNISHDYDLFMRSYKISGFTQLGFEF